MEDEEDRSSEMFTTFKNNMQQSDAEKLLFRLNLFPNYFSEGGRRMYEFNKHNIFLIWFNIQVYFLLSRSIDVKKHEEENDQNLIIHLTTNKPLEGT